MYECVKNPTNERKNVFVSSVSKFISFGDIQYFGVLENKIKKILIERNIKYSLHTYKDKIHAWMFDIIFEFFYTISFFE